MATNWKKSGDQKRICNLLFTMSQDCKQITNETVHVAFGSSRTGGAIYTELKRLSNARYGKSYRGDGVNRLNRMNDRRKALVASGFNLYTDTELSSTKIIRGSRKGSSYRRTVTKTKSKFTEDFSSAFRSTVKLSKLARWKRVEGIVKHISDKKFAEIYGSCENTIRRYRNGGKGYENGPPLKFIKFCENTLFSEIT